MHRSWQPLRKGAPPSLTRTNPRHHVKVAPQPNLRASFNPPLPTQQTTRRVSDDWNSTTQADARYRHGRRPGPSELRGHDMAAHPWMPSDQDLQESRLSSQV